MFVFKAAVVGAGTMGGEIAQVIASAGVSVVLKDIEQRFLDQGLEKARQVTDAQLQSQLKKNRITDDQAAKRREEILDRISQTTAYDGFGDVDFVCEAVPERMELKRKVFAELDALVPGHALLCSNTSALSISEMAEATLRPDRVLGFHFFYPASMMRLVEIIAGDQTSREALGTATAFCQQIRKQPIGCREVPGFVVNRVLNSAVSEIWRAAEEEGLEIEAVDRELSESGQAPMGPFYLSDLLGLDTVLHVAEHLQQSYGDRFYVSERMRELVAAGNLGQKSGKGFYEHTS